MPIIEIASLNSRGLDLKQDDFNVAILEEKRLKSHRRRFYDFLRNKKGTIVHIGNPDMKAKDRSVFFASEIIDWEFEPIEILYVPIFASAVGGEFEGGANQQVKFKFLSQFKQDIDRLLKTALEKSPIKKCYIFTDYYFGPEKERREEVKTISDLWNRHDKEGLVFNTIYELTGIEVCYNLSHK